MSSMSSLGPMPTAKFCGSCGNPLVATAVICPQCGTAAGSPKSKTTAILLAVFLGFWTWVYTYKTDKVKFWVGLASCLLIVVPVVGLIWVFLGIRIWAIIDVCVKPDGYYQQFPNGPTK
jgi:hypothetical protein